VLANDTAAAGSELNVSSSRIASAPQHGTASVNSANGSVTYQPAFGYSGTDSSVHGARRPRCAVEHRARQVRVQPAPVAANDTATLQANQNVTINVLANDTSSGHAQSRIDQCRRFARAWYGGRTNGEVVYTPAMGYSGLDTFQYSLQDNLGTTSTWPPYPSR